MITVYFYRHGLSCNNSIREYGNWLRQPLRFFSLDPDVSAYGKLDLLKLKEELPEVDVVLHSCLKRAATTAEILFQQGQVAPFLKELGKGDGNMPAEPDQHHEFATLHGKWTPEALAGDIDRFLLWLQGTLPLFQKRTGKENLQIAVIGHSKLFRTFLDTKRLLHGGCIRADFKYDNFRLHRLSTKRIFDGFKPPPKKDFLRLEGDANCKFSVSWTQQPHKRPK